MVVLVVVIVVVAVVVVVVAAVAVVVVITTIVTIFVTKWMGEEALEDSAQQSGDFGFTRKKQT